MTTPADIPVPESLGKTDSQRIHVYVIAAENDAVKIGVAKNVVRRLEALRTGQHRKLSIFDQVAVEKNWVTRLRRVLTMFSESMHWKVSGSPFQARRRRRLLSRL